MLLPTQIMAILRLTVNIFPLRYREMQRIYFSRLRQIVYLLGQSRNQKRSS